MLNKNKPNSIQLDLLQELYNLSVDKIMFNLPAIIESIYNEFMGTIGYQKFVFDSIYKCLSIGIYTELHFVPTKLNINEIDNVLIFADKLNINKVSFLGLVPHGRTLYNIQKLVLNNDENNKLKIKLKNIMSNKIRIGIPLQYGNNKCFCNAGINKLCIRYDGKVFGCETFKYIQLFDDKNNEIIPDSIYDDSLENIYFNSKYLIFERNFIKNQTRKCNEKCPVQIMLRQSL